MNPAEAYILKQPNPYQGKMLQFQPLSEQAVPDTELRYKYRLPFYYVENRP